MTKLAMFGGHRTIGPGDTPRSQVGWPVVTDTERAAVLRVVDSGRFTSNSPGDGEVQLLEREWAEYVGTSHCVAVSNGTAAIALTLGVLDLAPGDEVLVPALTFIGSAIGLVQRLLMPVFVDIDPVTYTMDPAAAEAAVTPRTRAILAVHLHGLPCDMAGLRAVADRHGLVVVEDAAQAHAATLRGVRAGALGDIACFSLNVTKNLPTCGEGGLITTDRAELAQRLVLHRQFGEDLRPGADRDYISRVLAGNEKLSAIQAAFTRGQLARLDEYARCRDRNVRTLLKRLAALPGVVVPTGPSDAGHAWHILRLRFDPRTAGLSEVDAGPFRAALHRALRAEGVPVMPYQLVPLPGQQAFQTRGGFGGGLPWDLPGVAPREYRIEDYPRSLAAIEETLTLQRWHLNPASAPVLMLVADAFEKVWHQLDRIADIARGAPYAPPWQATLAAAAR
jgi:dTDP-4-amino-4,6-dideoxygalactose transaminase